MLDCQKHLFHLPEGRHYMNCAYMAPLLRRVEEAGIEGIRRRRAPQRITADMFFEEADRARRLFARLIHVPEPGRIAIIPAASYGIATAARNTPRGPGQNIVLAYEQFPSNVYVWHRMARRERLELRTIAPPLGSRRRGEGWNERLLAAIDDATAVVALPHIHWTDGTRFDLEAIGERARENGAALVIDGTQSVGALPFDVGEIQPDAVICAAYKWLLGPFSIGLAYFGPRYDRGVPLEETWLGREGSEDFQHLVDYREQYQPGAVRYDVGERSSFILLPMLNAALEQILEWEVPGIQEYCRELTRELIAGAQELGFRVEEERRRAGHLFGLRTPAGLELSRVQWEIEQRGIDVSLRGSAVRVAPHVHNDAADVAALRAALRDATG